MSVEVIAQWNVNCHYVIVKTRIIQLFPTHAKGHHARERYEHTGGGHYYAHYTTVRYRGQDY